MTEVGSETGIEIRVSRCCGARADGYETVEHSNGIFILRTTVPKCSKCGRGAEFDLEHEYDKKKEGK